MKTSAPLSAGTFERIAHELGPCELVDGEIVPKSYGEVGHARIVIRAIRLLADWAAKSRRGQVLGGPVGIVVGRRPDTVRGADVLYISWKRLPRGTNWGGFLIQRPELVVEVMGQKDTWEELETKVGEYHRFGVDMVWVADPKTEAVRAYPRAGKPRILHGGDELSAPKLLPGFRCKVREFFAE